MSSINFNNGFNKINLPQSNLYENTVVNNDSVASDSDTSLLNGKNSGDVVSFSSTKTATTEAKNTNTNTKSIFNGFKKSWHRFLQFLGLEKSTDSERYSDYVGVTR